MIVPQYPDYVHGDDIMPWRVGAPIAKQNIDPRAKVDHGCNVHPTARVWQFASIIRGATIGRDCSIGDCVIVDGSRLGDRVRVQHGAFIDPGIVIGNDVFIGPNVCLCNDAWPRVDKIGYSMEPMIAGEFVTTRIKDGASIGAGVVVMPGITIGEKAMIAAGSVVTKNVPDGHLHKRDGTTVPIDETRPVARMRSAG